MTVITIQPTLAESYNAYVDEANPTINYASPNFLFCRSVANNRLQSLLQFDLSVIPIGSVVRSAQLQLYPDFVYGDPRLYVYRCYDVWYRDTVNWIIRPIISVRAKKINLVARVLNTINVLDEVQYWVNNPDYNLGFQLLPCVDAPSYFSIHLFYSISEFFPPPALVIDYTPGPGPAPHGSTHEEIGTDPVPNATESDGGLESAADKTKLDLIITAGAWIAPTLLNGWSNYGSGYAPVGYFKDSSGVVHLRGIILPGTLYSIIFDLPSGYRPPYHENFPLLSAWTLGGLTITSSGEVYYNAGQDADWISLCGVSFRTS